MNDASRSSSSRGLAPDVLSAVDVSGWELIAEGLIVDAA